MDTALNREGSLLTDFLEDFCIRGFVPRLNILVVFLLIFVEKMNGSSVLKRERDRSDAEASRKTRRVEVDSSTKYTKCKTHAERAEMLSRPLGPEYVSKRAGPGRREVAYLKTSDAINLANKIFGPCYWEPQYVFEDIYPPGKAPADTVAIVATCTVKVICPECGITVERTGSGAGFAKMGSYYESFQKARKEAESDALKRALRVFGDALGNCIYDEDYRKDIEKARLKSKVIPYFDHSTFVRKYPVVDVGVNGSSSSSTPVPNTLTTSGYVKVVNGNNMAVGKPKPDDDLNLIDSDYDD